MQFRKLSSSALTFMSALALTLTLFGVGQPAVADVFTIDHVAVDISARNALSARETAIDLAEQTAFNILLRKLTLEADHENLPKISETEIKALVEGIQIDKEKTASQRYLATISVTFNPQAVRELLSSYELAVTENEARSLLVLPVFEHAGAMTLWGEPNEWFDAWRQIDLHNRLQPLILPQSDLQDQLELSALEALRRDDVPFEEIQNRYRADATLTVSAHLAPDFARNVTQLTVTFAGTHTDFAIGPELTFEAGTGVPPAELLQAAAKGIANYMERSWKDQVVLRSDQRESMIVWQRLQSLDDWLSLKGKLAENPLVRDITLLSLRTDSAELEISHAGSTDQVVAAFALIDVFLVQSEGFWEIGYGEGGFVASRNSDLAPLRFATPDATFSHNATESQALSDAPSTTTLDYDPYLE